MNYHAPRPLTDKTLLFLSGLYVDTKAGKVYKEGAELGQLNTISGRWQLPSGQRGKHLYRYHVVYWAETGTWPELELDHVDGDRQNDAADNLEPVTHLENIQRYYRKAA